MKNLKFTLILMLFVSFFCDAQNTKLKELQKIYPNKKTESLQLRYKKYWMEIEKSKEPIIPDYKFESVSKFYNIPINQRLELHPFDIYDSIYIYNPKLLKGIEEPRNYLDDKYHDNIRLITGYEIRKLSDILFNYFNAWNCYATKRA